MVREEYGNISILSLSSSGSYGSTLPQTRSLTKRFLNMFGGHVELKGSYSSGAARAASIYTYGTVYTDHSRDDLLNSRLIILWGWNPVVTVFGSDTLWYLKEAKKRGVKGICAIYSLI